MQLSSSRRPRALRGIALLACVTLSALAACSEATAPTLTLALASSTMSVAQGATTSVDFTVQRSSYSGAIDILATGLPAGLTATANPTSLPAGTSSGTITFSASGTLLAGEYAVTVTAAGVGVEPSSVPLTLTVAVTGNFTLALQPSPIELYREIPDVATVTVARTGGFAQAVALTVMGLPAGVTASSTPASVAGSTATLAFTVSGSAPLGTHSFSIEGASPGVTTQVLPASMTIAAAPTTEPFALDFCADNVPAWLAYQNQGAAWTRVLPDGSGTFSFAITPKVSIAYVLAPGTGSEIHVRHVTRAELAGVNGVACVERSTASVGGSLAGVDDTRAASISVGGVGGSAQGPATGYSIFQPSQGVMDLVASRDAKPSTPWEPDRMVIRRAVTVPGGSPFPVIDFESAEAFTPASFTLTVAGAPASPAFTIVENSLEARSTGTTVTTRHRVWYDSYTTAPLTARGVPTGRLDAGDTHYLFAATSNSAPFSRGASLVYRDPGNVTLTLGENAETPALSQVASSPYARHRVTLAAGSYTGAVRVQLAQSQRYHTIWKSGGFLGAVPGEWEVTMPDFTGVDGWNAAWGMQPGTSTGVAATTYGPGVLPFTESAPRAAPGVELRWGTYMPFPFP